MAAITIEVENKRKLSNVLYEVTGKALRGRLRQSNLPANAGEDLRMWGDVPGVHISVDLGKKSVRIWDPIEEDPKMQSAAKRAVEKLAGSQPDTLEKIQINGFKTEHLTDASPKVLATHLWHMRRLVEEGMANLVAGDWPKELPTGPWPAVGSAPTPNGPDMYPGEPLGSPYHPLGIEGGGKSAVTAG